MADAFYTEPLRKEDVSLETFMLYMRNFQEVLAQSSDVPQPAGKRDPRIDLLAATTLACGEAQKILNCPTDTRDPKLYASLLKSLHALIGQITKANNPRFHHFNDVLGDWVVQLEKDFSIPLAPPDDDPISGIAEQARGFRNDMMERGEKGDYKKFAGLLESFRIKLTRASSQIVAEVDKLETIPVHERSKEDYAPLCRNIRTFISEINTSKYADFKQLVQHLTARVTTLEQIAGLEPPKRQRG